MKDKRYTLTCPDCGAVRAVGRRHIHMVKCGKRGPQCNSCANRTKAERLAPGSPICRHCSARRATRPRGLCRRCYYTPAILELYPSTSKFARRGHGCFTGSPSLPDAPTTAAPGTPDKIAVLEQRAKAKRAIFHPADARYEGDPRPLTFLRTNTPAA